jgi:hypothetical protein
MNGTAHLESFERITASLEIGETINPDFVTAALEKMGVVLYFDGVQYRTLEAAQIRTKHQTIYTVVAASVT